MAGYFVGGDELSVSTKFPTLHEELRNLWFVKNDTESWSWYLKSKVVVKVSWLVGWLVVS